MTRYVNIDRDTPLLLPPDLRDWVPADHLVHFVIDAVELIDTGTAPVDARGTGSEQYPPGMLLAQLVYSYATGMFSSRQIERASYENVAVRLLCAGTHPDHDTLCTFRRKNGPLLTQAFKQILELSARYGVLEVGQIIVAIDGTKIFAKASKHSAVSHGLWVTKTPSDSRVEKLGGISREDGGAAFRPLWVAEDGTAGPVRQQAPYSMGGCARRQRRAGSVHEITMAPFP